MKLSNFIKNNIFGIRIILTVFGTLSFFYAFFFYDKDFSFETIANHKNDIKMYICIIISLIGSIWISFFTGKIKSP
jgi:hypothetical protein